MKTAVGAAVPRKTEAPVVTIQSKVDESRTMKAARWYGAKDVRVDDVPVSVITDPGDATVRITTAAICGSVEEVGPDIKTLMPGDRVIICSNISCGKCYYCKHKLNIYCPHTNPGLEQELLFGHHSSGLFGYSHLTGGYAGGQAEYLRVPLADNGCLRVPPGLPDEKVLFLSDILCTAWYGCELGEVQEGDNVAIWGAGPVGMLTAHCCKARGTGRVVLIDRQQDRLDFAAAKIPGLEMINFKECKAVDALHGMFPELKGPDVCIEAVGFHYAQSLVHKVGMALNLETDTPEVLNDMLSAVRKVGRISMIGDWVGFASHVNVGALMEKGLTIRSGLCPMQKYWEQLLEMIQEGKLDPSIIVTHTVPLEEAPKYYRMFNDKADGCVKVLLKPGMSASVAAEQ